MNGDTDEAKVDAQAEADLEYELLKYPAGRLRRRARERALAKAARNKVSI